MIYLFIYLVLFNGVKLHFIYAIAEYLFQNLSWFMQI